MLLGTRIIWAHVIYGPVRQIYAPRELFDSVTLGDIFLRLN